MYLYSVQAPTDLCDGRQYDRKPMEGSSSLRSGKLIQTNDEAMKLTLPCDVGHPTQSCSPDFSLNAVLGRAVT